MQHVIAPVVIGTLLCAGVVASASLVFGLSRLIDAWPPSNRPPVATIERLKRMKLWQWMAAIAVIYVGLVALGEAGGPDGPVFALAAVGLFALALFARAWLREFTFLMDLADTDFPGKSDKLIWASLLIAAPPVGLWAFRAYREASLLEPAITPAAEPTTFAPHARPTPEGV